MISIKRFYSPLMDENAYALNCDGAIALIDTGCYTKELKCFVAENKDNIKYILLTHRHFDHVLGVADIVDDCPNLKIVIHKSDAAGLTDSSFSMAKMSGLSQNYIEPDILVTDGDVIELGGRKISVLHTPGHTEGSVCYIVDNAIFTGDTLFCGSIGRTDFESGSMEDMKKSLNILKGLDKDFRIFAGHGEDTTLNYEKQHNYYFSF